MSVIDPRASDEDLTAKARIRNAALDLYAEHGEDRVSMRGVATAAGVTVGLVQHHFKTKDGLRAAVEQLVVDYYALAIAAVPDVGTPAEVAARRDESVRQMLETHPSVVNYIRRTVLDPRGSGRLLERLTELSRSEVVKLRESGLASTNRPESTQIIGLMVRQFGTLLLQPMIDEMWGYLTREDAAPEGKPTLSVTVG
ncbi:TetR/AcrR family transcriptional regulator [Nocardia asteroides]|uniref:TetR/AcrR family transcriptional regulator n=1 Tax=Nocardia asteroides TaxID=1824 RepID=UPI003667015B